MHKMHHSNNTRPQREEKVIAAHRLPLSPPYEGSQHCMKYLNLISCTPKDLLNINKLGNEKYITLFCPRKYRQRPTYIYACVLRSTAASTLPALNNSCSFFLSSWCTHIWGIDKKSGSFRVNVSTLENSQNFQLEM